MVEIGPVGGWNNLKPPRKYENQCHFCKLTITTTEKNISWHPGEYLLIHNVCKKLLKQLRTITEKITDSVLTGNSEETERLRDEALRYQPPYALNLLVESFKEKKDHVSAIRVLEVILERARDFADTHIKLGDNYAAIREYKKAILHFKKAIKESEQQHSLDDVANFYDAHMKLADIYSETEKNDQSIKTLNKLLKDLAAPQEHKVAEIYFMKAYYTMAKIPYGTNVSESIISCKRVLLSLRQCLDEHHKRGISITAESATLIPEGSVKELDYTEYNQLLAEYKKMWKENPGRFDVNFGENLSSDDEFFDIKKIMRQLLAIPVITNFGRFKAWLLVFRIFDVFIGELSTKEIQRLAKKFPEIEERIKFLLENYQSSKNKKPDDKFQFRIDLIPATTSEHAFLYYMANNSVARGIAEDGFGLMGFAIHNCSAEIVYWMIVEFTRVLLDEKKFDMAKEALSNLDLLCKNTNYNRYASEFFKHELVLRYRIFIHKKNFQGAIDCMKEALDYYPSDYSQLLPLIDAYVKNKDFPSALEFSERLMKINRHITARKIHGDILYKLKKYEEALTFYQEIIPDLEKIWKKKEEREATKEIINIKIGTCQLRLSDPKNALNTFETILNQNEENLDALNGLKEAHDQLGNEVKASNIGKKIYGLKKREISQLKSQKKPTVGKSTLDDKLDFFNEQEEMASFDITTDLKFPSEWSDSDLLGHLEDMIRKFLQHKLGHLENWEKQYLIPANYKEAKRRQKDPGVPGVTSEKPDRSLVYYMSPSDYIHIMDNGKLWGKYFAECFHIKHITLGNLATFNKIRQLKAHHMETPLGKHERYEADKITYFFESSIKKCKES